MLQIGPYTLPNPWILAPMAGVSEMPFRVIAFRQGAALCPTELVSSQGLMRATPRTLKYVRHDPEVERPYSLQIFGGEPEVMAKSAVIGKAHGAQIIDINMGCPAKKVCNAWAGSALMREPALVARILDAVVRAVEVPVTLKIRTGWAAGQKNALEIARIAEAAGIQALAVHGRTRDQQYTGTAEYDTIAEVKAALSIPVVANGDIDSPRKAAEVLARTGCDAVMVGRAAQGRPWIFREIAHYLATGGHLPEPSLGEVRDVLLGHLDALHAFYGEPAGVRIARKHLGWYAKDRPENAAFRAIVNRAETAEAQRRLTREYFDALIAGVAPALGAAA